MINTKNRIDISDLFFDLNYDKQSYISAYRQLKKLNFNRAEAEVGQLASYAKSRMPNTYKEYCLGELNLHGKTQKYYQCLFLTLNLSPERIKDIQDYYLERYKIWRNILTPFRYIFLRIAEQLLSFENNRSEEDISIKNFSESSHIVVIASLYLLANYDLSFPFVSPLEDIIIFSFSNRIKRNLSYSSYLMAKEILALHRSQKENLTEKQIIGLVVRLRKSINDISVFNEEMEKLSSAFPDWEAFLGKNEIIYD